MEKTGTRVAIIGIIMEESNSVERLNHILHEAGDYIVGRMGIPRVQNNKNVICIVVDAPEEIINSISGKIGMCKGITAKVIMSRK
ncbi:MAG: iron-only hydrogenase system regulator [Lachnospiraceae bacterium]|nr:iron-only hydrogenase system regulator [Lachnospiraceae bacterium]